MKEQRFLWWARDFSVLVLSNFNHKNDVASLSLITRPINCSNKSVERILSVQIRQRTVQCQMRLKIVQMSRGYDYDYVFLLRILTVLTEDPFPIEFSKNRIAVYTIAKQSAGFRKF